jgi:hypothetical protein
MTVYPIGACGPVGELGSEIPDDALVKLRMLDHAELSRLEDCQSSTVLGPKPQKQPLRKKSEKLKQRKKKISMDQDWAMVNPNAAGVDLGSKEHWVAVPAGRDTHKVRSFGTFTPDLHDLAAWLKKCGLTHVAMEATGDDWIPLFQILVRQDFKVDWVNARQIKNVSGRKSDVSDGQWIQRLHSYGLLQCLLSSRRS